jgi:sec-independent protein translocase protein TatA
MTLSTLRWRKIMFGGGIGIQEILPIAIIVIVIFGAKRIPDIGKGLGEGIQNFKKAMKAPPPEETAPEIEGKKEEAKEEAASGQ